MKETFPLVPLKDRVIILPDSPERTLASGIIIPDTVSVKTYTGTVVASGKGRPDIPNETKAGDRVLFGKYAGTEVTYNGQEYIIVREDDILAIDEAEVEKK